MVDPRRCSGCDVTYPPHLVASAFRSFCLDISSQTGRYTRIVCRPCQQEAWDGRKIQNRWLVKARDVIRRHALRLGVAKVDLIDRYGWDQAQIAHDAEHRYSNGCDYCHRSYAGMEHGLYDITLDIVDRSKPPYYRTNTKWCCQTCNRKKGTMTPEAFELDRQIWEIRGRQMLAMRGAPQDFGRLFWLDTG